MGNSVLSGCVPTNRRASNPHIETLTDYSFENNCGEIPQAKCYCGIT